MRKHKAEQHQEAQIAPLSANQTTVRNLFALLQDGLLPGHVQIRQSQEKMKVLEKNK